MRAQLAAWTPAEPARAFTYEARPKAAPRATVRSRLDEIPVWAQVAAALLCVGVAAGVANLEVRYDRSGLTVRTGWVAPPAADDAARASATPVVVQTPAESGTWRADLTALEQQLRAEFRAATAVSSLPCRADVGGGHRGDPPPRPGARRAEREPAATGARTANR